MLDPAIGYLIVASIALLLVSAGTHKLRGLARFTEIFAAYRVLPDAFARRLAWLVPCLELSVAASLLWGPSRRFGVVSAVAILIGYASALSINLLRGRRDLDCGCGRARDRRAIAPWMVWRNLSLAAALGVAILPWSPRAINLTDFLTLLGGLLAGMALYVAIDRLLGDVAPKAVIFESTS